MNDVDSDSLRAALAVFRSDRDDGDWGDVLRRARRSHLRRVVVAVAVALFVTAGVASAYVLARPSPTPGAGILHNPRPSSVIPLGEQQLFTTKMDQIGIDDLAYMPTYAPPHYIAGGGGISANRIDWTEIDSRSRSTLAEIATHSILFEVSYWPGSLASCEAGATTVKTIDGDQISSDKTSAWQCRTLSSGRIARISATNGSGTPLTPPQSVLQHLPSYVPPSVLANIVASARRF